MPYTHYFTLAAYNDMLAAVSFYNSKSEGLGRRMAVEVDELLNSIATMPKVYSIRYRNIRAAKVHSFPYLVYYTINEKNKAIHVLRGFNTYQKPIYGH